MVKGTKKASSGGFTLKTGLFEATVVAINPTQEELVEITGNENVTEPEYLAEDGDGNTRLLVNIWLEEVQSKDPYKVSFYLVDKDRTNNAGTKNQYINTIGNTGWADSQENLPSFMSQGGREVRKAKVGEEELMSFVTTWVSGVDRKAPDTEMILDMKSLFRGNLKELTNLIGSDITGTVCCLATVRTTEKDGEAKQYQQVYNRAFMSGYSMKQFRTGGQNANGYMEKFWKKITDPEFGVKEDYTVSELKDYNPGEHIQNTGAVIAEDDSSY